VTVPARLRVVDGESAPARALAERALDHLDELFSLARHLCGNPSDAEDLVQDTYARALTGRFEQGTNVRAWLFRILRNAFIDHARRRQIVLEIPDDSLDPPDPGPDALRYVTGTEVVRAIGELAVELRFVVLLDVEGFTEAEIADIMRTPAGTVKSRLSRAKARLRVLLGGSR
jgi:RNA polymerase sigma-70 factor, ECF subfamily